MLGKLRVEVLEVNPNRWLIFNLGYMCAIGSLVALNKLLYRMFHDCYFESVISMIVHIFSLREMFLK